MSNSGESSTSSVQVKVTQPYDFILTLRAIRSFEPVVHPDNDLQFATLIKGVPTRVKINKTPEQEQEIFASSDPASSKTQLRRIAEWILFAELDLKPFYNLVSGDSKLSLIMRRLYGLKPTRPVSLFEMAVVAITEQQISLAAAYRIRSRIIQRFGEPVGDRWIFPVPRTLAEASVEDLRSCGLSRQKAGYIHDLSISIVDGMVDLNSLKSMNDEKAREAIMNLRGFGRWSADYILVRGLARPDCVPVDDLAVRNVVGEYLGGGARAPPQEVSERLEPFRPYRGLLAFYLLADHRLYSASTCNR